MKEEPIKICSSCGAEYSLMAQTCADCGGTLVSPEEYETRYVPLTEEEELVLIREGSAGYLRELSAHMMKRGVRASILLHGANRGLARRRSATDFTSKKRTKTRPKRSPALTG